MRFFGGGDLNHEKNRCRTISRPSCGPFMALSPSSKADFARIRAWRLFRAFATATKIHQIPLAGNQNGDANPHQAGKTDDFN